MAGRIYSSFLIAIASSLLLGVTAHAQIIGPGPKQHRLELGGYYGEEHYDRKFIRHAFNGSRFVSTADNLSDENAAATLRYGITESIYGILNFGAIQSESDYLRGRTGLMGILGIGLNLKFGQYRGVNLRVSSQYNDYFVMDPDYDVSGWRGRGAEVIFAGDRSFVVESHFRVVIGAGTRTYYSNTRYRQGLTQVYSKNVHYFSIATLLQLIAFDRVSGAVEYLIGSDTEWRLRVGVVV